MMSCSLTSRLIYDVRIRRFEPPSRRDDIPPRRASILCGRLKTVQAESHMPTTGPKKVSVSSPGRADGHHLGRGCSYSGPSPARSSASPSPAAARLVRIEQPAPLAQQRSSPSKPSLSTSLVHEGQTGGPGMPGRGPANVVGALPPPPRPRRLARLHHHHHRGRPFFFVVFIRGVEEQQPAA